MSFLQNVMSQYLKTLLNYTQSGQIIQKLLITDTYKLTDLSKSLNCFHRSKKMKTIEQLEEMALTQKNSTVVGINLIKDDERVGIVYGMHGEIFCLECE